MNDMKKLLDKRKYTVSYFVLNDRVYNDLIVNEKSIDQVLIK